MAYQDMFSHNIYENEFEKYINPYLNTLKPQNEFEKSHEKGGRILYNTLGSKFIKSFY